jgi:hypothetical protein
MDFDRGTKPRTNLLRVDGVINLVLGVLLIAFPPGLVETLGVPPTGDRFYPTVLGAVLFGIGVALLLEANRLPGGIIGLGLGGAIAINLAAAVALIYWTIWGDLDLPIRGRVLLGILSVGLVAISSFELWVRWSRRP